MLSISKVPNKADKEDPEFARAAHAKEKLHQSAKTEHAFAMQRRCDMFVPCFRGKGLISSFRWRGSERKLHGLTLFS